MEDDWRDFPPTCECLAECHALNHRLAYVVDCVNVSQVPMTPTAWNGEVKGKPSRYPFQDPFADGRWLRQAYTPHPKRGPFRTDAQLTKLNLELAERLERDARESREKGKCSGNGIWTLAMPWKHVPKTVGGQTADTPTAAASCDRPQESCDRNPAAVEACHCLPGWFGPECEHGPGSRHMPEPKHYCVKDCSGRGVCKLNWCHCVPGTWGIDCSLGTPDAELTARVSKWQLATTMETAAASATAANNMSVAPARRFAHSFGWPESML
eukprot:7386590-Prymnesium_polylepis.1